MTVPEPVLTVAALCRTIGPRTLWADVDITVAPGDALALRGPSGVGKSTLLHCIAGLDRPTHGAVLIAGVDVHRESERVRRRLRRDVVGLVVQDRAMVPEWTVTQNVGVVLGRGVGRPERAARIREALLALGLRGKDRQRVQLLSGGEQQRVAVARVLVQRPRLVLADEPTASLDDASADRVRRALDLLRAAGAAVVVATHDPALVAWADRSVDLAPDQE